MNAIESFKEHGFVVRDGLEMNTDLYHEIYHELEALSSNYPRPPLQATCITYNEAGDGVDYHDSLDNLDDWHLYRTRYAAPAKPEGFTDRSFEQKVKESQEEERILFKGSDYDSKEYFHYTPVSHRVVMDRHKNKDWTVPPEYKRLLNLSHTAHSIGVEAVQSIFRELENSEDARFSSLAQDFSPIDILSSPLRILGYKINSDQPNLAAPHFDKGYFTAAMHETSGGLQIARPDDIETFTEIVKEEHQIALFGGRQFAEMYGVGPEKEKMHPTWLKGYHRVVEGSPDTKHYSERYVRCASIMFINSDNAGFASKHETHL